MTKARVSGIRSVELGVPDLDKTARFYTDIWGLERAAADGDTIHLRGTGAEHHVLTLRQRAKTSLLGVHFAATDRTAVAALCAQARGFGVAVENAPAALPASAGGGFGFGFQTPDGLPMSISCDVAQHADVVSDRSRPTKIAHVVLNSGSTDEQVSFFIDVLGFRLSDSLSIMEFLRCSSDHHSVAVFRSSGPSLNHVAYELPNIDGLMRGSGRCKQGGFDIEWGVGRHGPGNNVYSYFIEPNGFVTEYTTEVEQIDEASYVPQGQDYWDKVAPVPDRWGVVGPPSNRMQLAMSGAFIGADDPPAMAERCEDVMARTLRR
jgi:catechol 2,3-dioxygenase